MSLTTNSNTLFLPVTLSNGNSIKMRVEPNEVFFDNNGYVWLFSIGYSNGDVGNFILKKKNTTKNQILEFFKEHIVPLGLYIVKGQIQEKHQYNPNLPAINLALWISDKYGSGVIGQIVDDINNYFDPSAWGYYEITTGEYVITNTVKIQLI